ncbi:hypothetical protein CDD82_3764 [Ophiocordyceps australis]|uniref:GST N-terminal domain-containing protein n=1 Tax=Ophiocordyceps australis TaxID=1399860 RepID=A0A2C5ZBV8_9HYPO|nr:hypothetical protein CDD82_3764 [Ophiocordyceps australis]
MGPIDDTEAAQSPIYTLHYSPYSLYSLMTRLSFVLGRRVSPETAPRLELQLIDLHHDDNFSEDYLTKVTPKGQVPVLTSTALEAPLDDSRDIAKWLCAKQPRLLPQEHREVIESLMDKIYAFHATALLVASEDRKDDFKESLPNKAAAMLERSDLSEGHRRALEIKSVLADALDSVGIWDSHDTYYSRILEPEQIEGAEQQVRELMGDLDAILNRHQGQGKTWIFGDEPTILDAHATVLASRLAESKRFDMVSEPVRTYADRVRATQDWNEVTQGRPTLWDMSRGHVADLDHL